MDQERDGGADRAAIVVPQVGRLVATSEAWTPFRLLDAEGVEVEGCSTFFGELRACGRSVSTVRSYGMDLLRWFRFLWALQIAWDRATRAEARDFSRWLQVAGKPAVSYTHLRAHETRHDLVCRLLLEKKKRK